LFLDLATPILVQLHKKNESTMRASLIGMTGC